MSSKKYIYYGIVVVSLSTATVITAWSDVDVSKLPPASTQKDLTYEKDIKPIVDKTCIKCHGPVKPKGKMRADSLAALLKGGESGKSIVPGQSAKSDLVHRIARLDPDAAMPPKAKDAFTKEQVSLIRAWIDQGAK